MQQAIQSLDESILLFIQNNIRSDVLTPIMKTATWLVDAGKIFILLAFILLLFRRTRRAGVDLAVCIVVPWAIAQFVFKSIACRTRPYLTIDGLRILVEPLSSTSFPSGHSTISFAAAAALTLIFGKRAAWSFLFAALVAFSRMYVGVHYLTDVLAGAVWGCLGAMLAYTLSHRLVKPGTAADKTGSGFTV